MLSENKLSQDDYMQRLAELMAEQGGAGAGTEVPMMTDDESANRKRREISLQKQYNERPPVDELKIMCWRVLRGKYSPSPMQDCYRFPGPRPYLKN